MSDAAHRLLAWYDRHARQLPWRAPPGRAPDANDPRTAYRVWLSEVMLQQTVAATVAPYWGAFVTRWPRVEDLAAAPLEAVLTAWAGLGYYARARNLHACAKAVVVRHDGRFPADEAALRALPGIGEYTAAAIAAIAFDRRATAVDGNIERVVARLFAVTETLPGARGRLRERAATLLPNERVGDYTQAMMDLGATICTPRRPRCILCPLGSDCAARPTGAPERFPAKAPKPMRPVRRAVAFWTRRVGDGAVLLRRRPPTGLLGGMLEVPSTPWRDAPPDADEIAAAAPLALDWRRLAGTVRHGFTHFELAVEVLVGEAPANALEGGLWLAPEALATCGLPTAMRRIAAHAQAHASAARAS